jgi:ATP synthase protein I
MAEERQQLYKSLGFLSSLGISMVAATIIGLAAGYYLDLWLGTSPWLTMLFLAFGIAAGFRNLFVLSNRELKRQQREDENNDAENG